MQRRNRCGEGEENANPTSQRNVKNQSAIDIPLMEEAEEDVADSFYGTRAQAADYESAGKSLFMCEHARTK